MKHFGVPLVLAILLISCQDKKAERPKTFISVLSLIRQQVAHVDTSLYSIVRLVSLDTLAPDTSYIRREEFAAAAGEFLSIPDLSDKKVATRYKEEEPRYDETLNRVIISYVPEDPAKEEVKKQEIMVTPDMVRGDKVNSILISRVVSNRDSFMEKKMLWQMDKSFQVITITQKPGTPEKTITTKVSWNEGL